MHLKVCSKKHLVEVGFVTADKPSAPVIGRGLVSRFYFGGWYNCMVTSPAMFPSDQRLHDKKLPEAAVVEP